MQIITIMRVLSVLWMLFALTLLPPACVAYFFHERDVWHFIAVFVLALGLGVVVHVFCRRRSHGDLRVREGFLVAVLCWATLSFFGAMPFYWAPNAHLSLVDAMFESTSGLTTTGATVFTALDQIPHSLLYYRQQLQWLGGMGIVVLAVAVLPMLGVGGLQLFQAEVPGPGKDTKMTPRIAETAKALWAIYLSLTVACIGCYWAAGMTLFQAVGYGFSTVSTGGFSLHDANFAFYQSPWIDAVGCLFMILSVTSFSLHYTAWQRKTVRPYWQSVELRAFLVVLAVGVALVMLVGHVHLGEGHGQWTWLQNVFTVVSMASATGFNTLDYTTWPGGLPIILLLAGLVGGCSGSTSGGIKVVRMLVVQKQGVREFMRLLHPRGVFVMKLDGKPLSHHIVQSVWGFLSVFFMLYAVLVVLLVATGVDFMTSFASVTSTLSNLGASIGGVFNNYAHLPDSGKWVLIFAMLAGRLEVLTLLVLFFPGFWRH